MAQWKTWASYPNDNMPSTTHQARFYCQHNTRQKLYEKFINSNTGLISLASRQNFNLRKSKTRQTESKVLHQHYRAEIP